jgi:hypothetical protein
MPGTACKALEHRGSPRGGHGSTAHCDRAPCVGCSTGTGTRGAFRCVPTNDDRAGFDAVHAEGGSETPGEQELRCVGWDSDSCTYVTQYSSRLEYRIQMPRATGSLCGYVDRCEATDACADGDAMALGPRTGAPPGSTGLLGWLMTRAKKGNWCDGRGDAVHSNIF